MILQFPLYWFSVPAILKGWFDRVLTQGFAFSLEAMYDKGVFKVSLLPLNEESSSDCKSECFYYNAAARARPWRTEVCVSPCRTRKQSCPSAREQSSPCSSQTASTGTSMSRSGLYRWRPALEPAFHLRIRKASTTEGWSEKRRVDNPCISCISVVINLFPAGSFQNGTLHFCGFQVLAPQIFWCPAHSQPAVRTAMLDGWRARLKGLMTEKPLAFAHSGLFNLSFQGGFLMRPEVKKQQESEPFGLTTGHHLGKPLPPDNQLKAPLMENCDAEADCGK